MLHNLCLLALAAACLCVLPAGDAGAIVLSPGALSFSSATYSGNEGSVVTITVTRTGGADGAASVDYQTGDGTAVSPADYLPAAGTLTWADGDSAAKTFDVTLQSDAVYDGADSFGIALVNAQGATYGAIVEATVNIVDAQPQPTIAFPDASAYEGDSGFGTVEFTATLSAPADEGILINYTTAPGSATGLVDYQPESGSFVLPAGALTFDIDISVFGDTVIEPDETFTVALTPAGYPADTAIGTILNDDAATLAINNVSDVEGDASTKTFTFAVTLANPSAAPVVVGFTTVDGTATAGSDYVAQSGTITFAPGDQSEEIGVVVNGDTSFEADETFTIDLTPPAPFNDPTATGTIVNDDAAVASLSVTKSLASAGPYFAGDEVTFEIIVANAGPDAATGVVVTDVLPDELEIVEMPPACSGTTTITCNVGTLASGTSATVTITARITQDGTFTNTASATANEAAAPASGSASITASAHRVAVPALSMSMLLALIALLACAAVVRVS